MSSTRRGIALVVALFVLLALGTTAMGLLFVSGQEALIVHGGELSARARWDAESAVRATLAEWSTRRYRPMAVGEVVAARRLLPGHGTAPSPAVHVQVERLAGRLYLVAATAGDPFAARAGAAALVRVIGLDELWRSFPAALAARAAPVADVGAAITAAEVIHPPEPWDGQHCPAAAVESLVDALGSLERPDILELNEDDTPGPGGPGPDGGNPSVPGEERLPDPARLGPLGHADIAEITDRVEVGTIQPAPVASGGTCDIAAPGNWGSPLDPSGPCGGYFPLIYAPGDVEIASGYGQGILVVEGDLVLTEGATFYGAVQVSGTLTLRDGATIFGAVTVAGDEAVRLHHGSRIEYRACPLWRAFSAANALDLAFAPAGRTWVPLW